MFKFHDDPIVNESKIVILLRPVLVYAGKGEGFGRGEGKMNLRGRESIEIYRQSQNWPNMSLFIDIILSAYFLLYLFIF